MILQHDTITFSENLRFLLLSLGLDIPKHGEPAYPLSSYGHGWSESPSAPRQNFPFYQTNGVPQAVEVKSNQDGGVHNPAVVDDKDTQF